MQDILLFDEFITKNCIDKKEFAEIKWQFGRRIILMGRAVLSSLLSSWCAANKPETSVLDGAIRDNYPVRIGF